ncbi:MAG: endonuclease/exonuclease/phosphatase family protein [Chthoniobacteraceae bacterium]|nr:endonuclease/exonuclease/phosphatase family protein [Chthoniobacteraceae bacterium]
MKRLFLLLLGCGVFAASVWGRDVVFAGYNLENYAPAAASGGDATGKPGKTEAAAAAVVQVVGEIGPDILGVCEMGPAPQFAEFRQRLDAAGLGYVDAEWVDAADPTRHLALVSRFPIVARQSVADAPYESGGVRMKVRRGFLDVTVEIAPGCRVRIVGAHLKSRLALPGAGNPDLERRQEAHLLRKHLDEILAADPAVPLLVYGDFNDTREQPAIREILGIRGSPQALTDLRLADAQGDRWTYYWKTDDVYSRIDFLFVNRALAPWVVAARSGVYRSPLWNVASDHRPVFATLHPPSTETLPASHQP